MQERERAGFMQEIAAKLQLLQDCFTSGQITKEIFLTELVQLTSHIYRERQIEEQESLRKVGEKLGFESLTTDTSGKRSTAWFTETGKAFTTGVGTRCLVAAVIHPEIGMGAAHMNFITLDVLRKNAEKAAEAFSNGQTLGLTGAYDMLTPLDIWRSTIRVTREAVSRFDELLPARHPLRGEMILAVAGLNFLPASEQETIFRLSVKTVQDSLQTLPRPVGVSLSASHQIGSRSGVIYGGRSHPQYSEPQFYNL